MIWGWYRSIIMEYRKIINLLDNTANEPSKFKTKNFVNINDESSGTYNKDNHIKFKTSTLRTCLCNYSNAYILVKGAITAINTLAQDQANNGAYKKVLFKNFSPFTDCISRINNTQIDDIYDINVAMPMYSSIEYNDRHIAMLWLKICCYWFV